MHTCIVRVLTRQEPVEDVVVTLYARQLIGNTRFLQQICKYMSQCIQMKCRLNGF